MRNPLYEDWEAWQQTPVEDLWLYDKLILSKKLGYTCGPVGVDVPSPGQYVVRPITNLLGMGRGAEVHWLQEGTDHLPVGYFWCKRFSGRHLSVDYSDGKQILCVEGYKGLDSQLWRWFSWQLVSDKVQYPLDKVYPFLNCEFIGGKLIEVHLRLNPDFANVPNGTNCLIPVWHDMNERNVPVGYRYIENKEFRRKGFFVRVK